MIGEYQIIYELNTIRWKGKRKSEPILFPDNIMVRFQYGEVSYLSEKRFKYSTRNSLIAEGNKTVYRSNNWFMIISKREVPNGGIWQNQIIKMKLHYVLSLLTLQCGEALIDRKIYEGWRFDKKQSFSIEVQTTHVEVRNINEDDTINIRQDYINLSENENKDRINILTHFYIKALELEPSIERYLMLWIALDSYPIGEDWKYDILIRYISNRILNVKEDIIKKRCKIVEMWGLRNAIVHHGKTMIDNIQLFYNYISFLEALIREILRVESGMSPIGELKKYMNTEDWKQYINR